MKINPIILRGKPQVDRAIEIIKSLPLNPVMVVKITEFKDSKSLAQLRTVHMWVKEVQEWFQETQGKYYTVDALKDYFKNMFGLYETSETPTGELFKLKSFASYTLAEMREFMDKMNHYCASELHIFLTIPGLEDQ